MAMKRIQGSRKVHVCVVCLESIPKGSPYVRWSMSRVSSPRAHWSVAVCSACEPLLKQLKIQSARFIGPSKITAAMQYLASEYQELWDAYDYDAVIAKRVLKGV